MRPSSLLHVRKGCQVQTFKGGERSTGADPFSAVAKYHRLPTSSLVVIGEKHLQIPERLRIYETDFWLLNHRINSALPGYLMLGSKLPVNDLSELPEGALAELGPLLARAQKALKSRLRPVRLYIGRYGHSPGYPIHFHLISVYDWVERLFWSDNRYRILERFAEAQDEPSPDGAELTLFIWREFCERANPPPIEGLSVAEATTLLRESMSS